MRILTCYNNIMHPGIAKLVSRLVWEKPPGQFHNFISGCCAVGSAPALGAGGPGFESPHSDHLSQKSRLFKRFFCIFCSAFSAGTIAVQRRFKGQKDGGSTSENCRRNRQIPNPSLTGIYIRNYSINIGSNTSPQMFELKKQSKQSIMCLQTECLQ